MALVRCEECTREISDRATSCIGCGAPVALRGEQNQATQNHSELRKIDSVLATVSTVNSRHNKLWPYFLILAAMLLLLFFRISASGTSQSSPSEALEIHQQREEQRKSARAVAFCDDEYKRMNSDRQYTPDVLQFHSMACRKMRDDYRAKWGREP
ncbi:hypothetical protein [Stenotrophomonas rhizophila]|uniref:hypothetical protein n=1 Tax=Stenotrophomonas rhizophila TaxID=216778 RepID=UPI0011C353F4|nr:hypothetical protein [Stenotrophomonas rhizophila]